MFAAGQKCAEERDAIVEENTQGDYVMVGGFVPDCDEQGNYNAIQCFGSGY